MMREVVVFDFDGTLITKDSLLEFIIFSKGLWRFYIGMLLCLPILIAYALKIYSNSQAKEKIFSHYFKGMSYSDFCNKGQNFSFKIDKFTNQSVIDLLCMHKAKGRTIYIVTASIEEWVRPWAQRNGIDKVIGTQIDQKRGMISGNFLSANCYGDEKVKRFLEIEPNRENYYLYVYGDSKGDEAMFELANEWIKISNR